MTEASLLPTNFGGLSGPMSDYEASRVLIWPIPFEKTVTYRRGTKYGPSAIIDASRNLELYDEEILGETAGIGIHTLPAADAEFEADQMIAWIEAQATDLIRSDKFLCSLGGEHSISAPIVRAHRERFPQLSVLQIDAHADLRDTYDGLKTSHACVMRRIVETCPAVQVGIRSLSIQEALAAPTLPTRIFYAKDLDPAGDWIDAAVDALSDVVYLTIDVDGLDPSIIPSTGTPEPGGLLWRDVLSLLRRLSERRRVVGMDVVELCGGPDCDTSAFITAKLIYKTLGYLFHREIPRP